MGEETKDANGRHEKFQSKYKLIQQFSSGSYGTVWEASPVSDSEKVYAVKIIDRSKLKKKDDESVFREVEIMRELQDLPHVIPLIDFLEEPQTLYITLFYARGGDLFRRLSEKQIFTEKDARDIAITLFETLDVMHSKHNVVHRDLKPENLLLESRRTMKIYFADFGFAKNVFVPQSIIATTRMS